MSVQASSNAYRGELVPLRNVYLVEAGWWRVRATIVHDPRAPNVALAEPPAHEAWEFGFVQNLLSEEVRAFYDGQRTPVVVSSHRALLDTLTTPGPHAGAWFDSERSPASPPSWASAFFGNGALSPDRVAVGFADGPRQSFLLRHPTTRRALLRLSHRMRFQIWLAARRLSSPPSLPTSYHALAQCEPFVIAYELRHTPPAAGRRATVEIMNPQPYDLVFGRGRANPSAASGPTANDTLLPALAQVGIGPRPGESQSLLELMGPAPWLSVAP